MPIKSVLEDRLKKAANLLYFLLLPLIFSVSCAHSPLRPRPCVILKNSAALFKKYHQQTKRVFSLKGKAEVRIKRPQESYSFSAHLIASQPSNLRFEALNFFGAPVAILNIKDKEVRFYSLKEQAGFVGGASRRNLAKILPAAVDLNELMGILWGAIKVSDRIISKEMVYLEDENLYFLEIKTKRKKIKLYLDPLDFYLIKASVTSSGEEELIISYSKFSQENYPREIEMEKEGVQLSLVWRDLEINRPLHDSLFSLNFPRQMKIYSLDSADFKLRGIRK